MTNLFAHRFRVGNGRAEESVPLEQAVEASPVVVSVARVRQTPRYDGVELTVQDVARASFRARTHATQSTRGRLAGGDIRVRVATRQTKSDDVRKQMKI